MGEGEQEDEKWGWYLSTLMACDSFLLYLAWLPMGGKVYQARSQDFLKGGYMDV